MEENFGHFQLGQNTHRVPMELHRLNREKLVNNFKAKHPQNLSNAVALLEGGVAENRHDTDHELLFRQESYFQYLFGVKEPDCFAAVDLSTGRSILFVPFLDEGYSIWMGKIHPPPHFAKVYSIDECYYTDQIETVLKEKGISTLHILEGINTDSSQKHKGATFKGIENFTVDKKLLFPILQECRVTKNKLEIELMRYAVRASCESHNVVMKSVKPGMMEYELESLFCHTAYSQFGCRHVGYTCICATGPNAAILHYGHAGAPNSRQFVDGDIAMLDMGAEYHCYGGDISRSYPVNGKFSEDQKEIYLSVLAAQEAVMNQMKAGVSWLDMHRLSNKVIIEQLKKYNFLKGDVDQMIKKHIGSLFMPHGLGHLLGLDTHDVGGYVGDMTRSTEPGLKKLRLGRVLEENMILTVEPGIYFIPSLLLPALEDAEVKEFLNEEKIRRFMNFGGVRIEDNVLVLKDGIENLSESSPRKIEDIEALMAQPHAS